MNQYPMTIQGAEALREELNYLKTIKRPEIVAAIAEAREHGDLKENAEYHAAREEQGFCEGRIQEIEAKLSNAQIIDVAKIPNTGKVIFGVTVTLLNIDTDEEVTYQIVGDDEADIKQNRISVNLHSFPYQPDKVLHHQFLLQRVNLNHLQWLSNHFLWNDPKPLVHCQKRWRIHWHKAHAAD